MNTIQRTVTQILPFKELEKASAYWEGHGYKLAGMLEPNAHEEVCVTWIKVDKVFMELAPMDNWLLETYD